MPYETEKEVHLANVNERQKTRMKEMEALFVQLEEEMNQKINDLTAEKKTMVKKIKTLESKLWLLDEEKAELSEMIEQLSIKKPDLELCIQEASPSESFLNRYENLQEKVDELHKLNNSTEAKLREMEKQMKEILCENEILESEKSDLNEALWSAKKQNHLLSKENRTLSETITLLQSQMEDNARPNVDAKERRNSIYDEIDFVRKITEEELKQPADVTRNTLEEELKRVNEQNCYLQAENNSLQLCLRRFAHSTLTPHGNGDQIESCGEKNQINFNFLSFGSPASCSIAEKFHKEHSELIQKLMETEKRLQESEAKVAQLQESIEDRLNNNAYEFGPDIIQKLMDTEKHLQESEAKVAQLQESINNHLNSSVSELGPDIIQKLMDTEKRLQESESKVVQLQESVEDRLNNTVSELGQGDVSFFVAADTNQIVNALYHETALIRKDNLMQMVTFQIRQGLLKPEEGYQKLIEAEALDNLSLDDLKTLAPKKKTSMVRRVFSMNKREKSS